MFSHAALVGMRTVKDFLWVRSRSSKDCWNEVVNVDRDGHLNISVHRFMLI